MVQNNEIQDEETVQTTTEEVTVEATRGRGRPAGSANKANDEVAELKKEIETLKSKVAALALFAESDQKQVDHSADEFLAKMDLRVSVLQQWVEMFHMFLTTSRITNSADRMAEDELTIVISKMPDQIHPIFHGVHAEVEN
jgi:predicted translin family RNA/ssDNA-binding protein